MLRAEPTVSVSLVPYLLPVTALPASAGGDAGLLLLLPLSLWPPRCLLTALGDTRRLWLLLPPAADERPRAEAHVSPDI
jgi:hypothetical protein